MMKHAKMILAVVAFLLITADTSAQRLRARRNRSTVPPPATVEEQSVPQQKTGEKLPVQPMPKEDEKPKDGTKPKEEVKTQQPTTATTTTTPQVQSRGRLFGRRTASDGYERRGLFGRRLRYRS